MCMEVCVAGCFCQKGFIRHSETNECISDMECEALGSSKCFAERAGAILR